MKKAHRKGSILLLILIVVIISAAVLGASMRILPNAPLFPTPTQPKAIDFPDSRPVPAQ